ncbi:MAG: hypothetical protein HY675_17855 [Chloroflexi bacterium]|nr:hypothetical protein [Chloroflexota bacterium]
MSDRVSISLVALMAPAGWTGVGYVVLNTTPDEIATRVLFFSVFYIALAATFSMLAYVLSFQLFTSKLYRGNLTRSLEQGGLWAAFALVAAILQATRMLTWIGVVLLVGALAIAQVALLLHK